MAVEPNELEEIHYTNLASHVPDSTDTSGESEDERDPDFIVEETSDRISHSQEQPTELRVETSGAGGRRGRGRGRREGMGLNQLLEIRDYWSTDSKLNNQFIYSRIT